MIETLGATKHTLHKVGVGFEWLGFDLMVTEPNGYHNGPVNDDNIGSAGGPVNGASNHSFGDHSFGDGSVDRMPRVYLIEVTLASRQLGVGSGSG